MCASTATVGSSGRGSASGICTRACASLRASSLGSSTTLPQSARRGGRSLICGRALYRARTRLAARTSCRSCVRRGWRRRRDATSRSKPRVDRAARTLRWEVVEAADAAGLGFDPAGFSSRGRASCLVCGAAVDAKYVKEQGLAGRMGITPLAAVLVKPSGRGRDYLPAGAYPEPSVEECEAVLAALDVEPPDEPIQTHPDTGGHVHAVRPHPLPRPLHSAPARHALRIRPGRP